jgi:large subunit ribosomal protein L46
LAEECGKNVEVWFVGRRPIGHYVYDYPPDFNDKYRGAKVCLVTVVFTALRNISTFDLNRNGYMPHKFLEQVFFLKAHILAGQVHVDNREIIDFAWVTKQEMRDYVSPEYYAAVKDLLSEL